jgi:hypothetical protein
MLNFLTRPFGGFSSYNKYLESYFNGDTLDKLKMFQQYPISYESERLGDRGGSSPESYRLSRGIYISTNTTPTDKQLKSMFKTPIDAAQFKKDFPPNQRQQTVQADAYNENFESFKNSGSIYENPVKLNNNVNDNVNIEVEACLTQYYEPQNLSQIMIAIKDVPKKIRGGGFMKKKSRRTKKGNKQKSRRTKKDMRKKLNSK